MRKQLNSILHTVSDQLAAERERRTSWSGIWEALTLSSHEQAKRSVSRIAVGVISVGVEVGIQALKGHLANGSPTEPKSAPKTAPRPEPVNLTKPVKSTPAPTAGRHRVSRHLRAVNRKAA